MEVQIGPKVILDVATQKLLPDFYSRDYGKY
jgi:hypothetical protein